MGKDEEYFFRIFFSIVIQGGAKLCQYFFRYVTYRRSPWLKNSHLKQKVAASSMEVVEWPLTRFLSS